MGRQAAALCHWDGQTQPVTALLEATEIILRGNIRARIPRPTISSISVQDGTLTLATEGGMLRLELGAAAGAWASVLRKPPPSLREKLGLTALRRALVIGGMTDGTLADALDGVTTRHAADAAFLVAEIHSMAELSVAHDAAHANAPLPIWMIGEKGVAAAVKDSAIRTTLRAGGYVDTKSVAVSAAVTGTLYRRARV